MFQVSLFLGFPVDSTLATALDALDPQVKNLFIQPKSEYLEEVVYREQRYLGKWTQDVSDVDHLTLLEIHIYSLLKKLLPNYPFEKTPLLLFPLETDS